MALLRPVGRLVDRVVVSRNRERPLTAAVGAARVAERPVPTGGRIDQPQADVRAGGVADDQRAVGIGGRMPGVEVRHHARLVVPHADRHQRERPAGKDHPVGRSQKRLVGDPLALVMAVQRADLAPADRRQPHPLIDVAGIEDQIPIRRADHHVSDVARRLAHHGVARSAGVDRRHRRPAVPRQSGDQAAAVGRQAAHADPAAGKARQHRLIQRLQIDGPDLVRHVIEDAAAVPRRTCREAVEAARVGELHHAAGRLVQPEQIGPPGAVRSQDQRAAVGGP